MSASFIRSKRCVDHFDTMRSPISRCSVSRKKGNKNYSFRQGSNKPGISQEKRGFEEKATSNPTSALKNTSKLRRQSTPTHS